jgi:anti-sigma B factor antagonist
MKITTERLGSTAQVSACGDIDSETAPQLDHVLTTLANDGVSELSLNVEEVSFLSSAGLSVLITAHREFEGFRLERGNRIVDRLIALTGLDILYGDPIVPLETSN